MRMEWRLAGMLSLLLLWPGAAWSGPLGQWRLEQSAAWSQFREAYYQSAPNQADASGTGAALTAFRAAWAELRGRWSDDPPPVYAEDATFADGLSAIAEVADVAQRQWRVGALEQCHITLSQIRSLMAGMRRRNGLYSYDDALEAFDDKLAEIGDGDFLTDDLPPEQELQLVEQVAVLAYLAERLETQAPEEWADDDIFVAQVSELNRQARGLRVAVLDHRRAAVVAALSDLRRLFDQLYLRYG